MLAWGRAALAAAAACFLAFFANVVAGAMGGPVPLADVLEMLVLFAAVLFFVAAVLLHEAYRTAGPPESGGSRRTDEH